jgi:hypothetical protein
MKTSSEIAFIVGVVFVAFLVLGFKGAWKWRRYRKRYQTIQEHRAALPNEAFCHQMGLDSSNLGIVSTVRAKLAEPGRYDPLRIYPEDDFYPHFGLNYDDDIAMTVHAMKIIDGYRDYSFPLEEVKTVADFVGVLLRIKQETERTGRRDATTSGS